MIRDERFYAFIVAHTSRSSSRIRRIAIHKRWIKTSICAAVVILCAALYGIYSFTQQAIEDDPVERENMRLRAENEIQRQQLDKLKDRVEAIEDTSRRLAEISGVSEDAQEGTENVRGAGGPLLQMDDASVHVIEARAAYLEQQMRVYENVLRERARIPSIWPVQGEVTDGFGIRNNPFGGDAPEFHAGQDIAAPTGAPVLAAGSGVVSFAGTQSGYGNVVVIDHGNGLSTRYGHLSRVGATAGQRVERGQEIGRVGSTGRSTGPHLHYEVRINGAAVSPRRYLPRPGEVAGHE